MLGKIAKATNASASDITASVDVGLALAVEHATANADATLWKNCKSYKRLF